MTAGLPTVGVDIGGSKIAAGLIDHDGRIVRSLQVMTPAGDGRDAILSAVLTAIYEVVNGHPINAVGIGAAGVIGPQGIVVSATNLLTGWAGTDIRGSVGAGLQSYGIGCPVVAVNDVHAHGAGEAWCGAGAGRDLVLLLAIGTGLGGAVLHYGRPLFGAHGVSGHLGHIRSDRAVGLPCSCGAIGHLEAIASGYGLVQLYHRLGGDVSVSTAEQVSRRENTDEEAAEALARSAKALGAAIGDLINIVDPDLVIISGSVSRTGTTWWTDIRAAANQASLGITTDTPIVPAMLGEHAGVIGAAGLAARAAAKSRRGCVGTID